MRSIKTMLLLACTAMVAVAFAVPAMASASNWKENGVPISGMQWTEGGAPLAGEGSISFSGPLNLTGSLGSLNCQVSGSASLSAGEQGHLNEFTVSPGSCSIGGLLKASGCTGVKSVTANSLPWAVNASGTAASPTITINGVSLTYTLTGSGGCSSFALTFTGKLTATPDKAGAIGALSLSGGLNSASGNVSASGTQTVSPAGKYGISARSASVPVSGNLSWTGATGGESCTVNGSLSLEAGSEGKITSLTASGCKATGLAAYECASDWMTPSTPWALVDNGTSIAVKNVSIGSCAGGGTGELTATPDKAGAISSTTLSGTLKRGGVSIAWSGTLNWTPAGVYGL
jgi:hypothetical protein